MRDLSARLSWLCFVAVSSGCGLGSGPVARIADGREYEGRAISAEAYGAYARGALLEAAGDDKNALAAYQAALSEDGNSPEIHARIGALRCRLAEKPNDAHSVAAQKSLSRALDLDPHSSSAWAETAHCAARRGDMRGALDAALRAADADPVAVASALLVAERAEAAGEPLLARTWLDELVSHAPESREAWAALARYAARHADFGRELRARAALGRLGALPDKAPILALGADPDDANAWVSSLVAADLRGDRGELERLLRECPLSPSALSPLAARQHAQLLERLIGPEARAAWLAAQPR